MEKNNKIIGASPIKDPPKNPLVFKIKKDSISEEHLTPELRNKINDYQNQIDGLEIAGVAVSNEFGSNPHISISQKTLTEAINSIWNAISDITGQVHQGFSLSITPPYYIGEHGSDVLITAVPAPEFGHFESFKLYLNGDVIGEYGQVDYLEKLIHIDEESTIKCEAKIMGIVYTEQKTIKHYSSFWIGAGETYESVIEQTPTPIGADMRGSFDVTVSETGQHIIVIVGTDLTGYIRADMNGFEIPMTLSDPPIVVGGKSYNVYTSDNVYAAGTYNIDING